MGITHKKKHNSGANKESKRTLLYKEQFEEYAKIVKLLGSRKVILTLPSGSEVMGSIPGRFSKRVWFTVGDIALVTTREFEANKYDIIYKYTRPEVTALEKVGQIPTFFLDPSSHIHVTTTAEADINFCYDDDEELKDSIDKAANMKQARENDRAENMRQFEEFIATI